MNKAAKSIMALDSGDSDLWGWAMSHWFGIAGTLQRHEPEAIPSAWHYRPGIGVEEEVTEYPDCEWEDGFIFGDFTAADLVHAGNVLSRYADLLKLKGLDY